MSEPDREITMRKEEVRRRRVVVVWLCDGVWCGVVWCGMVACGVAGGGGARTHARKGKNSIQRCGQ